VSIDVPTEDINNVLEKAFQGVDAAMSRFFMQLKQVRRVQRKFHVTLMHKASTPEYPELWKRYTELHEAAGGGNETLGLCDLILERVVYNNRIMAIVVRIVDDSENKWECVNRVAHITVGSRDASVKPKESNDLLAQWLEVGTGDDVTEIKEVVFADKPTIQGAEVKGVLSK